MVGSGSAPNPYIIAVTQSAAAPSVVPEVDVEDPLAAERARKNREAEERKRGKKHWFYLFAMLGTGFGYEPKGNHTEVAWQYQPSTDSYVQQPVGSDGAALSPLHVDVELGTMITRHLTIGVLGRFQVLTGANAHTTLINNMGGAPTTRATGAVAALLRVRYLFLEGRVHPYIHLDIGGGQIRHYLDVTSAGSDTIPLVDSYTADQYNNNIDNSRVSNTGQITKGNQPVCPSGGQTCTDSIALGYFLIGGGAGLWIDFLPSTARVNPAFILDLNLLGAIGVGGPQTGMNLDIAAGIGFHL
jgi:hypothetical protein